MNIHYLGELSRPDKKGSTPSSTYVCDGDEGYTELRLNVTLGSFTHPLMGGFLASTCACRGEEAHSLMCGSVMTSLSMLADGYIYGKQLRLFSIAVEEGCSRGEAQLCGPVTTSSELHCNSTLLADCVYVKAHVGMCGNVAARESCRGDEARSCGPVTTSTELLCNSILLADCWYICYSSKSDKEFNSFKVFKLFNSKLNEIWLAPKDVTYIFVPRNAYFAYDTSFLNHKKLVIDGDVESNPGPVNNNIETPKRKGRPPKKTSGFKGRKLDFVQTRAVDMPGTNNSVDRNIDFFYQLLIQ